MCVIFIRLLTGSREELAPETIGNPTLHHFLEFISNFALHQDKTMLPDSSLAIDQLLTLQTAGQPVREAALTKMKAQFQVERKVWRKTPSCSYLSEFFFAMHVIQILNWVLLGAEEKWGFSTYMHILAANRIANASCACM